MPSLYPDWKSQKHLADARPPWGVSDVRARQMIGQGSGMSAMSARAREVAGAILARASIDATTLDFGIAADRIVPLLGKALVPWIGAAGHGALLERALNDAAQKHPLLQRQRLSDGLLVDAQPGGPQGDGEVAAAMLALLGTYIDRLGRVVGTEMALLLTEQAFARVGQRVTIAELAATRKGEKP